MTRQTVTDCAQASTVTCAVKTTVGLIGGKWKTVLIYQLLGGTKRFSELQRSLPGATQRMLTLHLREMEADGLIHREVYAQVPPRVEYSVTPLGRGLEPVVQAMLHWGEEYLAQLGAPQPELRIARQDIVQDVV